MWTEVVTLKYIKVGDRVQVRWPGEWKEGVVCSLMTKGITVQMPSGGRIDIETPRAVRLYNEDQQNSAFDFSVGAR